MAPNLGGVALKPSFEEISPVQIIVLSAASWFVIKEVSRRVSSWHFPEKDGKWLKGMADKVCGFTHACLIVPLALYAVLDSDSWKLCSASPEYFPHITAISAGFFVWDIVVVLVQLEGVVWFVHACLSLYTYLVGTLTTFGRRYAVIFLLFELSTIPLYATAFAKAAGCDWLERICRVSFALTFLSVRIGCGFWWSYNLQVQMLDEDTDLCAPPIIKYSIGVINIAFNILNSYWAVKLVKVLSSSPKKGTKHE